MAKEALEGDTYQSGKFILNKCDCFAYFGYNLSVDLSK